MSDKQETIADIIAEMREIHVAEFQDYADRLEAAHRRELAAGGDAAALREALQAFAEWFDHDGSEDGYGDIRDKARAALVEPPRNCDRFATVEDARKAHEAICEKYSKCHNGCPLNNEEHYSAFDCFEAWLFAPVADREGGNDGN